MKKMIGVFAVFAMLGLILTCENTLYKNEAKKAAPKTEEEETGGGYYYPTYPQSPATENDDPPPAERVIKGTSDAGEVVLTLTEILEEDEPVANIGGAMFSVNRPVLNEEFYYTLTLDGIQVSHGTVKIENYTKWTFSPAVVGGLFTASIVGGYLEFDADAVIYDESEVPEGEGGETVDDSSPTAITIPKLGGGYVLAAVDEKDEEEEEEVKIIKVKSLTLNESTLTLEKDETFTLEATIVTEPEDAEVEIWWGSSKSAVASVTQDGVVTAKKGGTVTIKAMAGGKEAPCVITVKDSVRLPGLYKDEDGEAVNLEVEEGASVLAAALNWINTDGVNDGEYTILLGANEEVSTGYTIGQAGKINLKITLQGTTSDVTITKTGAGALFTVYGDSTGDNVPELVLENITLKGYESNTSALVVIGDMSGNNGSLTMKEGSRITENISSHNGGGVYVYAGSAFTMEGGSIDKNQVTGGFVTGGGGVYAAGTFTMSGGEITNNEGLAYGGGVWVTGTFTMSDGEISGNKTISTDGGGGGVYFYGVSFNMSGGIISGNESVSGGGVYASGNFTMSDNALIKGNTASARGGGVYFQTTTAAETFTMTGGSIEKNTAANDAAICRWRIGTFIKSGGTVYGTNAEEGKANVPDAGNHVIGIWQRPSRTDVLLYCYDETAGPDVELDSTTAENWGTP